MTKPVHRVKKTATGRLSEVILAVDKYLVVAELS